MVDIDVVFASNADTAAREIDRAAAATNRAGQAAVKQNAGARAQAASLDKSAAAARRYALEQERAAKKVTALEKAEAAQRRATLGRAAGVGGAGRAFAGASVAGSALGGGAGGLLGLGLLGAGIGVKSLVDHITSANDVFEKMVAAGFEWRDMVQKASDTQGKAGVDAIKEFGATLTDLIGRGGGLKEFADEIAAAGHPLAEAQKAVLEANRLFPGHERSAVAIGNDASRITGDPLSKSVSNLEGMPSASLGDPLAMVTALIGMHRGGSISNDDTLNARDAIESNPLSRSMLGYQREASKADLSNQSNILNAETFTAGLTGAVTNPLQAALAKQNTLLQQQVDIARAVYEKQAAGAGIGDRESFVSFLDRLINGKNSASGKYQAALEAQANQPQP